MILSGAVIRVNRIMDWIMEVVNLRCDGHYSGSNPDRRVKPASRVFSCLLFYLIILLGAMIRVNRNMDWIMEVVNLRHDGHYSGYMFVLVASSAVSSWLLSSCH